jgi:hypothetical protein
MDRFSLNDLTRDQQIALLKEFSYNEKDGYVVGKDGRTPIKDKYTDKEVKFDNMIIVPGSALVLDDNPFSIASYMEEYGVEL